jgi:hypothetical protein
MKKIWINGQEYSSVDEMPDLVRREYEEARRTPAYKTDDSGSSASPEPTAPVSEVTGMPDPDGGVRRIEFRTSSQRVIRDGELISDEEEIVFNGRLYSGVHELPPEARELYQRLSRGMEELGGEDPFDLIPGMPQEDEASGDRAAFVSPGSPAGPLSKGQEAGGPGFRIQYTAPKGDRLRVAGFRWGWLVIAGLGVIVLWILLGGWRG